MCMGSLIMRVTLMVILLSLVASSVTAREILSLKQVAAKLNVTSIYVFGDSSVDAGNNNVIGTTNKGNFPPYGKDFFGGRPTGRFSNGRLATDFIAESLGFTKEIRAFLDPNIDKGNLLHGVSFASAGSGYDSLTAELSSVLSMSQQLVYFKHYKIHLAKIVGMKEAEEIIKHGAFVMSLGTNDFLQNYYVEPNRPANFTVEQYQDYLISCLVSYVKTMHSLGARRLAVVGVLPFGCIPLVKTLKGQTKCDATYNAVAHSFNSKLNKTLVALRTTLRMRTAYVDAYNLILSAVENPKKYGFTETSIGCCGTGTVEYGVTCQGLSTCSDRTKYVFWDAVHPTEKMYKIVADQASRSIIKNFY